MFRWPDWAIWQQTALIFVVFAISSSAIVVATGLFEFRIANNPYTLLRASLFALIIPSLLEELMFRGPLVALQTRIHASAMTAAALASLTLFVLWHPFNAAFMLTEAQSLFFDWRFLVLALFLGIATTTAALRARSIWPAVAIHWAAVVTWKAFFGGPNFF